MILEEGCEGVRIRRYSGLTPNSDLTIVLSLLLDKSRVSRNASR